MKLKNLLEKLSGKLMGAMMALCVLGYISAIDLSSAQSELRDVVFGTQEGGYDA